MTAARAAGATRPAARIRCAGPLDNVPRVPVTAAPSTSALGRAVAHRRRELGLSQNDFATKCGIHRAYIGGIEQGRRNPTWRVLAIVAEGLELRLSELAQRAEALERELRG